MSDSGTTQEFRFNRGSRILGIIDRFSATEKVVFGVFVILATISALVMVRGASDLFKVEVPAVGGELREGLIGLPRTVNPVLAISDVDRDISALVYSGLMKYESDKIVTDVAQSYSISKDGLTYDFKLRDDVRFHDGVALTADDIEYTIQKILDQSTKSPRRADWANVTIHKISQNEIQFILKQPYAPFITNTTIGILPKHIWDKTTNDEFIFSQYNIQPVGSGPFKVDNITRNSDSIPTEYRLSSFDDYYGKKPYIPTIIFNFFTDEKTAFRALIDKKIQSLAMISPSNAEQFSERSDSDYSILTAPLPRVFSIFINQNQASILSDESARRALNMVVDREAIIEKVLYGYGTPLFGPLPANLLTNTTTSANYPLVLSGNKFDEQSAMIAAQKLLEKNGWKRGTDGIYAKKSAKVATTTLEFDIYTADAEDLKQTAQLLKQSWKTLGARVEIKTSSGSDLYQNVIRTRKYDTLLFGEQIGKDRDLFAFWHSSQRNAPGLNVAMYTNSKVDKLLDEIRTTADDAIRNRDYKSLDEIIRDDTPAIFLYSPKYIYIVPKNLKGISLHSVTTSSDRWNSINSWYLNTDKVWKIFAN